MSASVTMRDALVADSASTLFNPRVLSNLLDLAHDGLSLAVLVSVPALVAAFAASLLTGWLSSAAQIQDPALSFAPRLAAVAVALITFGAWGARTVLHFTTDLWQAIPSLVH